MTSEQAMTIILQIARQFRGTLDEHQQIQAALQCIDTALQPPPTDEKEQTNDDEK